MNVDNTVYTQYVLFDCYGRNYLENKSVKIITWTDFQVVIDSFIFSKSSNLYTLSPLPFHRNLKLGILFLCEYTESRQTRTSFKNEFTKVLLWLLITVFEINIKHMFSRIEIIFIWKTFPCILLFTETRI